MYAVLAVILLALAAFSVLTYRLASRRSPTATPGAPRIGDQLQGFLYVGAAAVAALALAVVVVGLLGDRSGHAESLAMFGLFTYAIYLVGALVLHRVAEGRGRSRK